MPRKTRVKAIHHLYPTDYNLFGHTMCGLSKESKPNLLIVQSWENTTCKRCLRSKPGDKSRT